MAGSLIFRSDEESRITADPSFSGPGRVSATDNAQGASLDADGMSVEDLERLLIDTRDEPRWRQQADRCVDYYDGHQLSDEVLADLKERELPPLIINLIQPTINTVLGMEARTRTDWRVDFEDEEYEEVALALNKKLVRTERESGADTAISNAYAGQVKAGLHWVEVGYNAMDALARCPYRVRDVHRREIWWDWRKRDPNEWRYLVRKQWFDQDQLILAFPKFKDLIRHSMARWGEWNYFAERLDDKTGLARSWDIERAFRLEEQDWRDTERRRAMIFEVWYRKWVRGFVARLGNGRTIELDVDNNIRHAQAVASGAVTPRLAMFPKMRQAIYIGPHRVLDRPSPLPHRKFPYVPFFGFREDLSGMPYGLIQGMLSPQDEINARRSKLMALMNSRRAQFDSDAIDKTYNSVEDVVDEVSRHDSVVVTNPERKNRGTKGVLIEDNRDLAAQQYEVLQESKANIHDSSGVFPPMAGDNRGVPSGVALNALVEQGTQTLAEINDNYSWSRREVGDLVLEHIKADSLHEHAVTVGEGRAQKKIVLNERVWDEDLGQHATENDVAAADVKTVLEDVPSTPSYRAQESQQLSEITKSLPPQMQAFVVPFWLESTNIKDRKKLAALLRRQLGLPEPGAEDQEDPRLAQLQQQLQQFQQEHQQVVADLTEKLKTALLAVKDKSEKNDIAATDAETRRMQAESAVEVNEIRAMADVTRSEFPKGGSPNADQAAGASNDAIEELIAVTREGLRELHQRMSTIEKHVAPKDRTAA